MRASWSPLSDGKDSYALDRHVAAWVDALCVACGMPPLRRRAATPGRRRPHRTPGQPSSGPRRTGRSRAGPSRVSVPLLEPPTGCHRWSPPLRRSTRQRPGWGAAPDRSPSMPSAPRASATDTGRSSCSSAGQAPEPCSLTRWPALICPGSMRPWRTSKRYCTRPDRTCPASPSLASGRSGCSTPKWPDAARLPASRAGHAGRRGTRPRLEKSHSAADWSTRPLPTEWLKYAALDVEVLVELRDALAAQLAEQDKTAWAEQEFAAVLAARPAAAADRPVAPDLRHPPGQEQAQSGDRARTLAGTRPDRPASRHLADQDLAGRRHRGCGPRPLRAPWMSWSS